MVVRYERVWVVLGEWSSRGKERESKKNNLKSSSSLPLHAQKRRRTVPFKTALFHCFFLRKGNVIGKNPKIGYDSCPPFTMLTKQRLCVVSFFTMLTSLVDLKLCHCFFLRKGNVIGKNPKIGYDSCPPFTMLTKQRLCVVSFFTMLTSLVDLKLCL
jgi:hypothetical protein